MEWANKYGWDEEYGGIYDELDPKGNLIKDTKRLWPFAEALKANALMIDSNGTDKVFIKLRMNNMVHVLRDHYIEERGFWTEWLNRDLSPATDYMPGTTPYHVYFGIMETKEILQSRGKTKSLTAGIYISIYTLRRALSNRIKFIRENLKNRS